MGRVHRQWDDGHDDDLDPYEVLREEVPRVLLEDEREYEGQVPDGLAFYNLGGRLLVGMRWDSNQRMLVEVDREEVARWLA